MYQEPGMYGVSVYVLLVLCAFLILKISASDDHEESCNLTDVLQYSEMNFGNPSSGFEALLTAKGLQYASDKELATISTKLNGQVIPQQSGKTKIIGIKVDYSFTGGRVTSFSKPAGQVSLAAGALLTWYATGASASVHANWHYSARKGFVKWSDHGSVDISMGGVEFKMTLGFGVDSTSHPTVRSTYCAANVASCRVKFHGGASWLYNLFKSNVEKTIKKSVSDLLCNEARKAIDVDLQKSFSKLKMVQPFAKNMFLLDYGLSAAPISEPTLFKINLKAETLWAATPEQHCPLRAPPLPGVTRVPDRMVYLVLTDYLINSLAYQAHTHQLLRYNLTKADVSDSAKSVLNTTCDRFSSCVGSFVPQVSKLFPDCDVQLSLTSSAPPALSILPDNATIALKFTAQFVAVSRTSHSKASLFTLALKRSSALTVSLRDNTLVGKQLNSSLKYEVDLVHTNVGPVNPKYFDVILPIMDKSYLKPLLDEKLSKGIQLPDMGEVRLLNPELQLLPNSVLLSTDLQIA